MENTLGLPLYGAKLEINRGSKREKANMRLETLRVPRASELVADKLRSFIVEGVAKPGTSLPSEKELGAQLGISRATLREALRMLESEGLISTRTGPKGGIVVQRPGAANLTRSLSLLLQLEAAPFSVLLEARRLLEPLCANLAAQRITTEELTELEGVLNRMRAEVHNVNAYVAQQLAFHLAVFAASHNAVLRLYTTSVGDLISARTTQVGLSLEERQVGLRVAADILAALKSRNGTLAARRVELHLRAFEAIIDKA